MTRLLEAISLTSMANRFTGILRNLIPAKTTSNSGNQFIHLMENFIDGWDLIKLQPTNFSDFLLSSSTPTIVIFYSSNSPELESRIEIMSKNRSQISSISIAIAWSSTAVAREGRPSVIDGSVIPSLAILDLDTHPEFSNTIMRQMGGKITDVPSIGIFHPERFLEYIGWGEILKYDKLRQDNERRQDGEWEDDDD